MFKMKHLKVKHVENIAMINIAPLKLNVYKILSNNLELKK